MELPGPWVARPADDALRRTFPLDDLDDSSWAEVPVPGHWQSTDAFADEDGPLLYRTRFTSQTPAEGRRTWLELDGLFYQGDVWLDGSYLDATEGYFFTHALEITDAVQQRDDHLLAGEVTWPPRGRAGSATTPDEQRTLTGTTQEAGNPGGIWRPVRLRETGPVPIRHVRIVCTDANPTVATLALRAVVHTDQPRSVVFHTTVLGVDHRHQQPLAAGENRVEWSIRVPRPPLWWPAELGEQPLFNVTLTVTTENSEVSDRISRRIGFRSVRMRDHIWHINGERLFLRGVHVAPLDRDLASVTPTAAAADVRRAVDAGLNLLRVTGHVSHPALYDAADEAGLLIWQDLPLQGGYHRSVRGQAMRQAREMVDALGHHPSVALWCGHDDPEPVDTTRAVPHLLDHQKPTWTRSVLDVSVRRAIERQDPSRPVLANAGVLPSLPRPADANSHLRFGWYSGQATDLADFIDRFPRAGRFVSTFGSQSVPDGADDDLGLTDTRWPLLDWDRLADRHGAEVDVLLRRFPPEVYPDLDTWAEATREHQAHVCRIQIEALRRRKYHPTGGFALDGLVDGAPAVSGALFDHLRRPKPALAAVAAACAPTIVVADPLPGLLTPGRTVVSDVTVVHDGRTPLEAARVTADLDVAGETLTWAWEGRIDADHAVHVGRIEWPLGQATGPVVLRLELSAIGADQTAVTATNTYAAMIDD